MKLVKIDDIKEVDLELLQKDFSQSKELIHGCNGLMKAKELPTWRKTIKKLENKPPKNKARTLQFFIMNDSEEYLMGVIDFRLTLLPFQEIDGGHISYTIRKSDRGKGYAKEALMEVLRLAREESDLKEVLLTCKKENEASKKVIQSCGGEFEKSIFINNSYIEHYRIKLNLTSFMKSKG